MGFESYQVPDYKGLVGDTSDNLPGIKGIGEKTAIKLLDQYKTLENIISNVNELKGKVQSCVLEHQNVGLKCKMLATLKSDFEVPFSLEEITKQLPNYEELVSFFKMLEFNSFLKKIEKELVSLKRRFGSYFNLYCGQAWRKFTPEQVEIVQQIAEYIVQNGCISNIELSKIKPDLFRKAIPIFGPDKINSELQTISNYIFNGRAA